MVNHGASRACLTCKIRRIKCDEATPACQRCIRSNRTCLGYGPGTEKGWRDVGSARSNTKSALPTLPVLPSSTLTLSQLHLEPDPQVQAALKKFLFNFVLVPEDRSLSRGYFDGLEYLLVKAGPNSELFRAARIVALTHTANTSSSKDLLSRARIEYPNTLVAFQKSLDDSAHCKRDEALMTAALLGLYEMMVATEAYPNAHSAHIKGVSAILCTKPLPLDLIPGVRLFQCFNSFFSSSPLQEAETADLLSSQPHSATEPSTKNLDALMLRLRPVLLQATKVLSNPKASKASLSSLKQAATLLNKEFSLWPLSQPNAWMPQTLGLIEDRAQDGDIPLEFMPFYPGSIDMYYDLYVVAVWDTYRKARLKLLQVIADCSNRLQSASQPQENLLPLQKLQSQIRELVDGLCASVPFHLTANLNQLLQSGAKIDDFNVPGKALGGLLLMYPLYIASTLPLISSEQRIWMKGRLRWIGKNMRIQQATMLAETDRGPWATHHLAIADGHSLVFSGSLISSESVDAPSFLGGTIKE